MKQEDLFDSLSEHFESKAADLDEPDPIYEEKDPKKKDTSFVGKHQVLLLFS